MTGGEVLSISQLNSYVKSIVDSDINLQTVFVCGEISNFTNHYKTGHFYFSLKDEASAIKAVMFKGSNAHLRFMPENGMRVLVRGRVGVFERDGVYQLYVDDMIPDGAGALGIAFEQLKSKLAGEGLFAPERKKPIPRYPMRIGVVTSPTGAAVRDIINILSRRFPLARVVMCPVAVQGNLAAGQICDAINRINAVKGADVLIVGRGGGSAEDLWAFNEEAVARAVAASEIPVISAVGHETDFTICDFAADLRAPTPSAAAELAVPDIIDEKGAVDSLSLRLRVAAKGEISAHKAQMKLLDSSLLRLSPSNYISNLRVRSDMASFAADKAMRAYVSQLRAEFATLCSKLDALSPLKIFARGYSVAIKNGKIIGSVSEVLPKDNIRVRVADGEIKCTVNGVLPPKN